MHCTDALRPPVTEDTSLLASRSQRHERGEAVEALLAAVIVATVLGTLAGWRLPL